MMNDDFSQFSIESPETLIADEGIDEVHRLMQPCRNCGELRPRGDLFMSIDATCLQCRDRPETRQRDTTKILALWEQLDDAAAGGDEYEDDDDDDENDDEEEEF
jgi:hypothetical protein